LTGADEPCGPQAPRDIGRAGGTNPLPVPGDGSRPPRLCNVHFHRPAEHAGIGACPAVRAEPASFACAAGGGEPVRPGDEIEVHWVYTSCPATAERRGGLADCVCEGPAEMELMVFGQEYAMTTDGDGGAERELREPSGDLARYAGSTTGPGWSDGSAGDPRPCSPARVEWAVARQCRALTLSALDAWCATNEWNEDHAHGVRQVIDREDWLAPYTPAVP
ncbi:MAG TPA: delta-class carbonic anhydrase, partial [Thermoanaerobaculia bacterium]|nr:delta-class carbonic anhydrase [Thermoanaerobaculia bacterium]